MHSKEVNSDKPLVSIISESLYQAASLKKRLNELGYPTTEEIIADPPADYIVNLPALIIEGQIHEGEDAVSRFIISHDPRFDTRK